jgi:hypothetical protein
MGIGGCLMSIHEPAEAASWIEDNWDNSFLASIQNSHCGGPFACMLSPTEPALAIFGRYDNPKVMNIAESLAGLSGFPVLIRPLNDNPALTLLCVELCCSVVFNTYAGHSTDLVTLIRIVHRFKFGTPLGTMSREEVTVTMTMKRWSMKAPQGIREMVDVGMVIAAMQETMCLV